jgi:hypothetical protein
LSATNRQGNQQGDNATEDMKETTEATTAIEPHRPDQTSPPPTRTPDQVPPESPTKTSIAGKAAHFAAQNVGKPHPRGGAPWGNRNGEKHRGKANVVLGQAPSGYMRIYTAVRKLLAQLKAEYESRYGKVTVSTQEALQNACHWLVRSRCWHKWARQPERSDEQRNAALTAEAECHDRYINRLRSIGLARQESGRDSGDLWASLPGDNSHVPPTFLTDDDTDTPPECNTEPPGACTEDVGRLPGATEGPDAAQSELDGTKPGQVNE